MPSALLTGLNGTVGRALAAALRVRGVTVHAYPRTDAPDDPAAINAALDRFAPDVLFHLAIASQPRGLENESWRINVEWPMRLAAACRDRGVRFISTSTAMVFSDDAAGPFTVDAIPDRTDGYGFEKRTAENRIRAANPDAYVARLGWQIGDAPGGNDMLIYLEQQHREKGAIAAATRWLPACSFLEDTAAALCTLGEAKTPDNRPLAPGIYHVDSNDSWTFFAIARALNHRHGDRWKVTPTSDFVYDQRLLETRLPVPRLESRLPELLQ
jgi:dTDP-4-dehydrorhamnose reductase